MTNKTTGIGLNFEMFSAILIYYVIITWRSSVAALQSSFLAAICKAGSRTFPLVSFSNRTATTLSCPCCIATASGVNPS